MTEEAAAAIHKLVSQPELPDGTVLRFATCESHGNGAGPDREIHAELVPEAPPRDVILADLPISVEPESVPFFADKVLDAEVDGDAVEFKLYRR
jgi:hypothetical protein